MKVIIVRGEQIIGYGDQEDVVVTENPNDGILIGSNQIAISTEELQVVEIEEELAGNYWEYEFIEGVVVPKNI